MQYFDLDWVKKVRMGISTKNHQLQCFPIPFMTQINPNAFEKKAML